MSSFVQFLESVGCDAGLRQASTARLSRRMDAARIDAALSRAVLEQDRGGLEALLGASANVCCGQHIPEEEDESSVSRLSASLDPA